MIPRLSWRAGLAAAAVLTVVACQQFGAFYGPFRVVPGHLEKCPTEMSPPRVHYKADLRAVRDRSKPDVWYYSTNGTLFTQADDNYTMSLNIASWSSRGGWKENAYMLEVPKLCTALTTFFPDLWRKAIKASTEPERLVCPVVPLPLFAQGYYSISNVSTDFDIEFPPTFFYGKWRSTGVFFNTVTKEIVGCVRAFFDTVPKAGVKGKHATGKKPSDFSKIVLTRLNLTSFNSHAQIQ